MSTARRRASAAILLLFLLAAPAAIAAEPPAPSTAAPGSPAPPEATAPRTTEPQAPRAFTVYFPGSEAEKPRVPAAPRVAIPPPPPPSPWLSAGIGLVFLLVFLAWMRLRSPNCPRCKVKMAVLEPEGAAAEKGRKSATELLACPSCDELLRRKHRLFLGQDRRCPACGAPTKVARLVPIERPGYLTWGRVRIDAKCGSCDYRSETLYAAPLLEAPPRLRSRRRAL